MATFVNLYFTDLAGVFRNTSIMLKDGENPWSITALFDGSSVEGFLDISMSDLILKPIKETEIVIPWDDEVLGYISRIYLPDGGRYSRDPRFVAEKTMKYVGEKGYEAYLGVELEFFIFDKVNYLVEPGRQYLEITSGESPWTGNRSIPLKKGYHLIEPIDRVASIRREIMRSLSKAGIRTIKHHHEVASSGQVEITSGRENIVGLSDFIQYFKMFAKKIARLNGAEAVFMPKPVMGDNGNGLHVHVSLWRDGRNLFYDPDEEFGLSQSARYFIGGLLDHGRSLSAIVSPTVNSYRRLIPGYEAPVYLAWGPGNRSAAIRIPLSNVDKKTTTRIEYRPPDPSVNPYLAISAIVLAGLDGIDKKIDPGSPVKTNIYKLDKQQINELGIKSLPRNLEEALDELENDHEYLKPVFDDDLLEAYIDIKRREIRDLAGIPAPSEFLYYYNI